MSMPVQPFVGVCGIQDAHQFRVLQHLAPQILAGTDHFMMVAVKNVNGAAITSGKFHAVRPFVHCDFVPGEPFGLTVERTISQTKGFVRGIQLNVLPWMKIDFEPLLRRVKASHPGVALVLQAHRSILRQYTPRQVADRLSGMPIDYILFDASQSNGIAYDPERMRSYLDAVYRKQLDIGVVVAGGLSGPTMGDLFAPLAEAYPLLSCDAFKRLQNPATQTLCWQRTRAYLASWKACIPALVV